jgi:mutual gliding-motility protein MglA
LVLLNQATREITAKVVYYGPGLCGKTSNLQFIYDTLDDTQKGKMLSLATDTDRTLFFDFMPMELGTIRGFKVRVQLYTVPGQVFYEETRKRVLKGADGVVFVADSQRTMRQPNLDSFKELHHHLRDNGLDPDSIPTVLQYNKRDLKDLLTVEELDEDMNPGNIPFFEAIAKEGVGVEDTLRCISKLVLKKLMGQVQETQAPKAIPQAPRTKVVATEGVVMDHRKLLTELGVSKGAPAKIPSAPPPSPPPPPPPVAVTPPVREEEVVLSVESGEESELLAGESDPLALDESSADLLGSSEDLPLASIEEVPFDDSSAHPFGRSGSAELSVLEDPPALATDSRKAIQIRDAAEDTPPAPQPTLPAPPPLVPVGVPTRVQGATISLSPGTPLEVDLQIGGRHYKLTLHIEEG